MCIRNLQVPRIRTLVALTLRVCLLFLAWRSVAIAQSARPEARRGNLDDTFATIDQEPNFIHQLACLPLSIDVHGTFVDARVFSLRFAYDPGILQFTGIVAGPDLSLHLLPPSAAGGLIMVDGFWNPNFTGTELLFSLGFTSPLQPDTVTAVGWNSGIGFSGTPDAAQAIVFTGDTTIISLEGTLPLGPDTLVIRRLAVPAHADSVELLWTRSYYDEDGDTLINPIYVVYREEVRSAPGIYDSIGFSPDTFFYDDHVQGVFFPDTVVNVAVYEVRARKTQP